MGWDASRFAEPKAYGCRRLSESEARSRLAMGDDEGLPQRVVSNSEVVSLWFGERRKSHGKER